MSLLDVKEFVLSYGIISPTQSAPSANPIDNHYEELTPALLATRHSQDVLAAVTDELIEVLEEDHGVLTSAYNECRNWKVVDIGIHIEDRVVEAICEFYGEELIKEAWSLALEIHEDEQGQ